MDGLTRAAGPGGVGADDTYALMHTGVEIDAAVTGWHTAQTQANATAADIAEGKKAITKYGLVTGTMTGGGGSYDPTDPMSVYKATRPADWLPMPEPSDGEAYMLYLVPPTDQALFAIQVTFSGNATIQLGEGEPVALTSEAVFETEFNWDSCKNLTSDGLKQVMIKISGNNIIGMSLAEHSKRKGYTRHMIVDFSGNLPYITSISIANITTRYFSLTKDAIDDMTKIFGACYSLVAITKLDTSQTTIMSSAFSACFSLVAVPQMNTSKVTNMKEMFYNCYSLTTAPKMDTSNVSSMEKMFYNCYALTTIPQYNTSVVTSMANMFQNCYSLITIPQMNTSKVTAMGNMFYNCREITHINKLDISKLLSTSLMFMSCNSLSKISFGGETIAGGTTTIAITDSFLSRTAIVELFSSLPTAANSAKPKLTLTGNPGVPDLTDEDKAIATAKGWTLTL